MSSAAGKKRGQPGLLRRLLFGSSSNSSRNESSTNISSPTLTSSTNKEALRSVKKGDSIIYDNKTEDAPAKVLAGPEQDSSSSSTSIPLRPSSEDATSTSASLPSKIQTSQIDPNFKINSVPKSQNDSTLTTPVGSLEDLPPPSSRSLAQELFDGTATFVSHEETAAWLGDAGKDRELVRNYYMDLFDFTNQSVLLAFRRLCEKLYMKGESQQLNRILDSFTDRWAACNPHHGFKNVGVIYTLAFSILLLNTDHHSEETTRKKKISRSQFTTNTLETIRNFLEYSEEDSDFPVTNVTNGRNSGSKGTDHDNKGISSNMSKRASLNYSHDNMTFVNSPSAKTMSSEEWESLIVALLKYFYNSIDSVPLKLARIRKARPSVYQSIAPIPRPAYGTTQDYQDRKQSATDSVKTSDSDYQSAEENLSEQRSTSASNVSLSNSSEDTSGTSLNTLPPITADVPVSTAHHRAASLYANSVTDMGAPNNRHEARLSMYLHSQSSTISLDGGAHQRFSDAPEDRSNEGRVKANDFENYLSQAGTNKNMAMGKNESSAVSLMSGRSARNPVYRRASWIGGSSTSLIKTESSDYQQYIAHSGRSSLNLTRTNSSNSHLLGKRRSMISMPSNNRERGEGLGFAAALRSTLIREEQAAAAEDMIDRYSFAETFASNVEDLPNDDGQSVVFDAASSRRPSNLSKDELALHGAPWAKEGLLNFQAVLDTNHSTMLKRYKRANKDWIQVFVVVQNGYLKVFRFDNTSQHQPDRVVGSGNWTDQAVMTDSISLCHTLAQTASVGAINGMNNSSPAQNYTSRRLSVTSANTGSDSESAQFTLTLPDQKVLVFQAGTQTIAEEYVYACNYWAARVSKEPLVEAVSSLEYGWNKPVAYFEEHKEKNPGFKPKIYSGSFDTIFLDNHRIQIRDWKVPVLSSVHSKATEEVQLKTFREYIDTLQESLAEHSATRGYMIQIFQSGHLVSNRAHGNWEKRSRYLLTETIKYEVYVAALERAVKDRASLEADNE